MLRIPAALEKGNQERLLPMAPEFAELLLAVPKAEQVGRVFRPGERARNEQLSANRAGDVIKAIGAKAKVKVATSAVGKVKYASAHDLRRSFGERWAARIMPQQLMELMRHESIETTMRYYVGRNAQSTAETLSSAYRDRTAATQSPETSSNSRRSASGDQLSRNSDRPPLVGKTP
jgi:integrase